MGAATGRRRGRLGLGTLAAAVVAAALIADPASGASTPSQLAFAICPHVTGTTYPDPSNPPQSDCGRSVFSAGFVDAACVTHANSDLGTFLTTQNPFGIGLNVGSPGDCTKSPPTLGPGAGRGSLTASVTQTGFCPTTLTIQAQTGQYGLVRFPIGNLPLGRYGVTVTFPEQTVFDPRAPQPASWSGTRATGTLVVGSAFKETAAEALTTTGKSDTFAVVLRNSVAGPGAAELVSTRAVNRSVATLRGTEYYACGTIGIVATVTYGRRGVRGVVRLSGVGSLTGGTGNYAGIKGDFKLSGSYSTKTKRGSFVLTGEATY